MPTTFYVNPPVNPRPSVPSDCEATDNGSGQTCDATKGAKSHWLRTGRHWNMNPAKFNARTLSSEASLSVLFEEQAGINTDVIGLSEVSRRDEAYTVIKNGHVLYYRGLVERRERGVGFLMNKDIAGNREEFYSVNDRVERLVIKRNKRYKFNVVQAYHLHPAITTS